jgi:hypothetical protein
VGAAELREAPIESTEKTLVLLDLRTALGNEADRGTRWAYDVCKAVASLQGLANREQPRLFVRFLHNQLARERGIELGEAGTDDFWFDWLRKGDRLLASHRVESTTDIWKVFQIFEESFKGIVLWDETVPSTANVASTLCGAEGLLPIRGSLQPESFHQQFLQRFPKVETVRDFRGMFNGEGTIPDTDLSSTGSAKCDAYLWAVERLLKTGKCSSQYLAFYIDGVPWDSIAPQVNPYHDLGNAGVFNADYWIGRKAFFFDLSPWQDHPATDDPTQQAGTDYRTLISILEAANRRNENNEVIVCGGFLPWWLKYCKAEWGGRDPNTSPHDPVPTEWLLVDILSAYNTLLDADAFGLTGLANASVYRHSPLQERYAQTSPPPKPEYDPETTYVLFAMLDYDSSAWLAQAYPVTWQDPKRGQLPLLWGINPVLADRVPMVFDAIFSTRSENDWIGTDEGLGYINFNLLGTDRKYSSLPPFGDRYLEIARPYFDRFAMDHTAFVITGHQGPANEEALRILGRQSPGGVGFQAGNRVEDGAHHGTVFKAQEDDWNLGFTPEKVAERLEGWIRRKGPGEFLYFRCILMTPSQIVEGVELLRKRAPDLRFEVLDPYSYFSLLGERKPR